MEISDFVFSFFKPEMVHCAIKLMLTVLLGLEISRFWGFIEW